MTPQTTPRWEDVLAPLVRRDVQGERELQRLWQERAATRERAELRVRRAVQSLAGTGLDLESRLWAAYHVLGTTPMLALGNRWGLVVFAASRGDGPSVMRASHLAAEAAVALRRNEQARMMVTDTWVALRLEQGRHLVACTTLGPIETLAALVVLAEPHAPTAPEGSSHDRLDG